METATRYGSRPNIYPSAEATDVTIEITMKGEGPRMGEDAQLTINMKNGSSEKRSTILHSQVAVMYYTGVQKATMKKDDIIVQLEPNESKRLFKTLYSEHSRVHKLGLDLRLDLWVHIWYMCS